MTQDQIESRLETDRQTPRHLCRLYLFACASRLPEAFLFSLRQRLCLRLNLSEEDFYQAFAQVSMRWQARIDRMELEALSLPAFGRALRRFRKKGNRGCSWNRTLQLQARFLSLVLQTLSIQQGKNHLKTGDLNHLRQVLFHPQKLGKWSTLWLRPFRKVMQGDWKPATEDFLLPALMHTQLLADYLQADSWQKQPVDHTGKKQVILEFLQASRWMSPQEMSEFLHPQSSPPAP